MYELENLETNGKMMVQWTKSVLIDYIGLILMNVHVKSALLLCVETSFLGGEKMTHLEEGAFSILHNTPFHCQF